MNNREIEIQIEVKYKETARTAFRLLDDGLITYIEAYNMIHDDADFLRRYKLDTFEIQQVNQYSNYLLGRDPKQQKQARLFFGLEEVAAC